MDRATILIVDDDDALREGLIETVADLGHKPLAASTGDMALAAIRGAGRAISAVLLDLRMPGQFDGMETLRQIRDLPSAPPVAVLTAFASAENTIEAMRLGAFDHLTKPVGRDDLRDLLARMIVERGIEDDPLDAAPGGDTFVGPSEAMRQVQKLIGLAADSDATVLVTGETGTGKEMIARALHTHSSRRCQGPFVAVNAAAIPGDLLESELFGHIKGAFTGAVGDRSGAFRDAHGGTLLLDEIGDMPLAMQAKILRVIQDRMVAPVGGRAARVDVRLIAATHRDLSALVAEGRFRADLYYRLNVVPIALAPLRERLADIIPLAEHFLRRAAVEGGRKRLTPAAASRLLGYRWPGNVRELKNVVERATVLVRGSTIDADDLALAEDTGAPADAASHADWLPGTPPGNLPEAVARLEKTMIRAALADCGGNRAAAARALGIHRQQLYAKMQRYGFDTEMS
jgi:DNA-binding NtrC family response regulator